MLHENIVKLAQTERASAILFTSKKDGAPQFCAGNWKLDAVIQLHSYPIIRIEKCIDLFGDVAVFSTLGANNRYCP